MLGAGEPGVYGFLLRNFRGEKYEACDRFSAELPTLSEPWDHNRSSQTTANAAATITPTAEA